MSGKTFRKPFFLGCLVGGLAILAVTHGPGSLTGKGAGGQSAVGCGGTAEEALLDQEAALSIGTRSPPVSISDISLPTTEPKTTTPGTPAVPQLKPLSTIYVRAFCLAEDDGSGCEQIDLQELEANFLEDTRALHKSAGTNLSFEFDPNVPLLTTVKSSFMRKGCHVPPGVIPDQVTSEDVNNDNVIDGADQIAVCDWTEVHAARLALALMNPENIVVFFVPYSIEYAVWNAQAGHWEIVQKSGGALSTYAFVILPFSFHDGGNGVPHELTHEFFIPHPMNLPTPRSLTEAAEMIKAYVEAEGLQGQIDDPLVALGVFDPDRESGINDTPPDPGPILITKAGAGCGNPHPVSIEVDYGAGVTRTYSINPNRHIVTGYHFCKPFSLSPDQVHLIQQTSWRERVQLRYGKPLKCFEEADDPFDSSSDAREQIMERIEKIAACVVAEQVPVSGHYLEFYEGFAAFQATSGQAVFDRIAELQRSGEPPGRKLRRSRPRAQERNDRQNKRVFRRSAR